MSGDTIGIPSGKRCCWHHVGRGLGCCSIFSHAQDRPTAKNDPAQRSTALRLRNTNPPTFDGFLRDLPEREVSLWQGDSGQLAAEVAVSPMTEAGSWKTELDLLVAFLLLFKQPRQLGHGSSSEDGLKGPA